MIISGISGVVSNTAIGVLSAITFMKGFHRSLALVQQRRMRNMLEEFENDNYKGQTSIFKYDFATAPPESVQDESSFGERPIGCQPRDDMVVHCNSNREYVRLN